MLHLGAADIGPRAAPGLVEAAIAVEEIEAGSAVEGVVAVTATEDIRAALAQQPIVTGAAEPEGQRSESTGVGAVGGSEHRASWNSFDASNEFFEVEASNLTAAWR